MSCFRLLFGHGPTPTDPTDARALGWEQAHLGWLMHETPGRFMMPCHAASVPELVAYVRTVGRDCTYRGWGERQALLYVGAER